MTIGIIGTGRMALGFAKAITATGVPPLLSSARPLASGLGPALSGYRLVPLSTLLQRANIVILALPFPVAVDLLANGAGGLGEGRVLLDITNPRLSHGALHEANVAASRSGGEVIAEAAPCWLVAKSFNAVPAGLLEAPRRYGRPMSVPVATDHAPARSVVFGLARRLGFDPIDAGGISASAELESLAVLEHPETSLLTGAGWRHDR
jgi:predicted dinucleotide-binding enzyme